MNKRNSNAPNFVPWGTLKCVHTWFMYVVKTICFRSFKMGCKIIKCKLHLFPDATVFERIISIFHREID